MTSIVLAGGLGTRVRSLTSGPKTLMEVNGRAMLDHIVDHCCLAGSDRIFVLAGYLGSDVEKHIAMHTYPVNITVLVEKSPMGTAGSLLRLKSLLKEPFFVLNGDTFILGNIRDLMTHHTTVNAIVTVGIYMDESRKDAGNIVVDEETGWVDFYAEKDPISDKISYVNAGIYAMTPEVFSYISEVPCSLEQEVFPVLVKNRRLSSFVVNSSYDIGTVERFLDAERWWTHARRQDPYSSKD